MGKKAEKIAKLEDEIYELKKELGRAYREAEGNTEVSLVTATEHAEVISKLEFCEKEFKKLKTEFDAKVADKINLQRIMLEDKEADVHNLRLKLAAAEKVIDAYRLAEKERHQKASHLTDALNNTDNWWKLLGVTAKLTPDNHLLGTYNIGSNKLWEELFNEVNVKQLDKLKLREGITQVIMDNDETQIGREGIFINTHFIDSVHYTAVAGIVQVKIEINSGIHGNDIRKALEEGKEIFITPRTNGESRLIAFDLVIDKRGHIS